MGSSKGTTFEGTSQFWSFEIGSSIKEDIYNKSENFAAHFGGRFIVNVLSELSVTTVDILMRIALIAENFFCGCVEMFGVFFSKSCSVVTGFKHIFILAPKIALSCLLAPYYSGKNSLFTYIEIRQSAQKEMRQDAFITKHDVEMKSFLKKQLVVLKECIARERGELYDILQT